MTCSAAASGRHRRRWFEPQFSLRFLLVAAATLPVAVYWAVNYWSDRPRVAVIAPVFDAGAVPADRPMQHDFKVCNASGEPVRLASGKVSGTLRFVNLDERTIPPRSSAIVRLAWTPSGSQGTAGGGRAEVHTDDPVQPVLVLQVRHTIGSLALGAEDASGPPHAHP